MFAGAAVIPMIPIFILLVQSPQVVIFDIFKYHMFYRRSDWEGATRHDFEVFTSWIEFPQSLILGAHRRRTLVHLEKKRLGTAAAGGILSLRMAGPGAGNPYLHRASDLSAVLSLHRPLPQHPVCRRSLCGRHLTDGCAGIVLAGFRRHGAGSVWADPVSLRRPQDTTWACCKGFRSGAARDSAVSSAVPPISRCTS